MQVCAWDRIGELGILEGARTNVPCEIRMGEKLSGRMAATGCYQPNEFIMMHLHEAHGFGNITVVADNDGAIVSIQPSVIQQMNGEIDI